MLALIHFRQQGTSLIELMIASILGLLLLATCLGGYIMNKQAYFQLINLARIQENGRLAMHLLRDDIQTAGYIGCGRLSETMKKINGELQPTFSNAHAIMGFPGGILSETELAPNLGTRRRVDSDGILIEKVARHNHYLSQAMTDPHTMILKLPMDFSKGEWLSIGDCAHAEIFKLVAIKKQGNRVILTADHLLQYHYNNSASVNQVHAIVYFIADTGRKNKVGHIIYALHRRDLYQAHKIPDEVIEGVSRLQIRYGIRQQDNQPILEDQTATEVSAQHAWTHVVSVKLALLFDSIAPVFAKPKPYEYFNQLYQPGDQQMHKEWDSYIALRERN